MTWFKVDDKLHSHKKSARAGVAAMGLWTLAGSWSADHLTDGFVPDYIAHRLAPGQADELAKELVNAGLWFPDEHDGDEGWRFKDWPDYQPTREDEESRREREREKKRSQRRNSAGQFDEAPRESPNQSPGASPGDIDGTPQGVTPSRPDPTRNPRKEGGDAGASPPVPDPVDASFEDFWSRYPRHARNGKPGGGGDRKPTLRAWRNLSQRKRDLALAAVDNYRRWCESPDGEFPKHAQTWLNAESWEQWQEAADEGGSAQKRRRGADGELKAVMG